MRSAGGEGITGLAAAGGGSGLSVGLGLSAGSDFAHCEEPRVARRRGEPVAETERSRGASTLILRGAFGKLLQCCKSEPQLSLVAVVGGKWKNPVTATRVLENAEFDAVL